MPARTADDLVARLRDQGVRITTARRAVLEALVAIGSHATAETLHDRVVAAHPDVSPSSVYRTLDLLSDHGIVNHVHLGHGPAEYHLASERHAHLVCERCGEVRELHADMTADLVARVADELDFALDLRHFALTGRCARCAAT